MIRLLICSVLAFGAMIASAGAVSADDNFYAGKRISIIVGSSTGGGYDAYARLIARHWDKAIPGQPSVIVQNMPGASSLKAMNHVANTAAKDGTVIGAVQNQITFEPVLNVVGKGKAQYDSRKLNWIGSANKEVATVFVWHTTPVNTIEDAKKTEVLMGSSGVSTASSYNSQLMNELIGTRFKVVYGYSGNSELALAIERGEIQGSTGMYFSSLLSNHPQWISEKKVKILAQLALEKHPALPNVPLILDQLKGDARKQFELIFSSALMGRPFVMAAGVPDDRVRTIRQSFLAVLKDPALLAEAKRANLEIQALSGEAIQKLVAAAYATPAPVVKKVRQLLQPKK
jgi:tripartite-type tricarboxylate transporter receptor subunit TctC